MAHASAHIVIIDNDPATRDMHCLVLEEEGRYRVTATSHVFEEATALELLHPDLIILDVLLPERAPGWTLLQKLRHYAPTQQIPIIITTTAPPMLLAHQPLLTQHGVSLLSKPFDIEALLHQISFLLSFSGGNEQACGSR